MSVEMKWLPVRWMDEYVPDPQSDPNAFICHNDDIGFFLQPVEDQNSSAFMEGFGVIELKDGETVRFNATEAYGDFTLIVREDGTFETDEDVPDKANCFRVDRDTDTLQPSLAELVETGYGVDGGLQPGSYDIDAYWWSEEEYAFAFSIVDGKGRLTQVGAVQ